MQEKIHVSGSFAALVHSEIHFKAGCSLIGQALTIKIEMRFPGLLVLKLPWDIVDFASSAQSGTGLVEMERDTVFDALHMARIHAKSQILASGPDSPPQVTEHICLPYCFR